MLNRASSAVGQALQTRFKRFFEGLYDLDYDYVIMDTTPGVTPANLIFTLGISDTAIEVARDTALEHLHYNDYVRKSVESITKDKFNKTDKKTTHFLIINEIIDKKTEDYFINKYKDEKKYVIGRIRFDENVRKIKEPLIVLADYKDLKFSNDLINTVETFLRK